MWCSRLALSLGSVVFMLGTAKASVTVYYQQGQNPFATTTAAAADYTGSAAYDPTILIAPAPPADLNKNFNIQLLNEGTQGASIPQQGRFFGFSVEMSVVNQVFGRNSSFIQVPFLNLMSNIVQRAGSAHIRVGGNTQETAKLVESTPDGRILEKDLTGVTNPTQTPPLIFTPEFLRLMAAISTLVNIDWYLGIPFFDVPVFNLDIAERGQEILGDRLIGIQVANEPDLYLPHGHRPEGYDQNSYFNEFGLLVEAMNNEANAKNRNLLIGPNIAMNWVPQAVWDTGFVDAYNENLVSLAVERYPSDNCFAQYGVGTERHSQDEFPKYLLHNGDHSGKQLVLPYLSSAAYAQTKGKPFMMFETNTASCGGFAGISDSFGAGLWALDYAMTLAHSNFTGALFHVGGQNVFYNPFTPPPTNQSEFHQWTVGPIYYSALITAEALGPSNKAQVLDLQVNSDSDYTPGYAIYEDGKPVRVLLINYVSDATGNSDVTASISIGGGETGTPSTTPTVVQVKYFRAASVSQKGNFTWANQTFGDHFTSDGRPMGTEEIVTVPCENGICNIQVFAPSAALVFLGDNTLTEDKGGASTTYATTARTKTFNTVTVDPLVLATSNGHGAMQGHLGSTSKGSVSAAQGLQAHIPGLSVVLCFALGGIMMARRL